MQYFRRYFPAAAHEWRARRPHNQGGPMRTRLMPAATALVALANVAQAQQQPCLPPTPVPDFDSAVIRTTDLGNRIYMLEGVSGTVGGNVVVAVGDDGVILIDNMFPQMVG